MIDIRSIRDVVARIWFELTGKMPWKVGYVAFRNAYISSVLQSKKFNECILQESYGSGLDERAVEYPWLFSRLPEGGGRLLDAGSVLNHKFIISQEALRRKTIFISTLSPEPYSYWRFGISYIFEDLRDTCFKDDYFDWVVSLSTIEHIGLDNTLLYTDDGSKRENLPDAYLTAAKEYRRVLKKGGTLYLSIPFGTYKNHGWFQVLTVSWLIMWSRPLPLPWPERPFFGMRGTDGRCRLVRRVKTQSALMLLLKRSIRRAFPHFQRPLCAWSLPSDHQRSHRPY